MALNFDINNDLNDFYSDIHGFDIDNMYNLHFTRDELYVLFKSSVFASNCLSGYLSEKSIDIVNGSKIDRFFDLLGDSIMKIGGSIDV